MLPDSGHIQEMDAKRAARQPGRGKGRATEPLYTVQEARDSLGQLRSVVYGEPFHPHPSIDCVFRDAGHILGSAILEIQVRHDGRSTKLVASGDLGQPGRPIVRDPEMVELADVLLIESTYGDRAHRD